MWLELGVGGLQVREWEQDMVGSSPLIHSLAQLGFSPPACWTLLMLRLSSEFVERTRSCLRGDFSPVTPRPCGLERCLDCILKVMGDSEGFMQGEWLNQGSSRDYKLR